MRLVCPLALELADVGRWREMSLGRMVEKGSGGTYTQFVFRPSGAMLAVYSGGLVKGTIPLPGGSTAIYNTSGVNYIRHKDWLGSSRLATTWVHAVYSKEAYAPFGETYNEATGTGVATPDRSFTGQDQDVVTGSGGTGVYDFLFRKYDPSAGRWLSPDPAGWGAVDQTAPQSLNRYAYVENQPMTYVDPTGLIPCVSTDSSQYESGFDGCNGDDYPYITIYAYGWYHPPDAGPIGPIGAPDDPGSFGMFCIPGGGASFGCMAAYPSSTPPNVQLAPSAPNNPIKNWPLNGNLTPGTHQQDQKCSAGSVIGPSMDSIPGVLTACQWHDNKYIEYNCNATSWISPFPGPCKAINYLLLIKIYNALPIKPF
jgi:RHS repeat-associated protein